MPGTIAIHGSDDEVMAPLGSGGNMFRGRHQDVRVTAVNADEMPLEVSEALVGLTVGIIFTYDQLKDQKVADLLHLPAGMVLAYGSTVIQALLDAGKMAEAELARECVGGEFDMVGFAAGTFELISG